MASSIILALKSYEVTEQEVLETCKHKLPNLLGFNGGDETISSFLSVMVPLPFQVEPSKNGTFSSLSHSTYWK